MALQFGPIHRTTMAAGVGVSIGSHIVRIYPSSVPYPETCPTSSSLLPAGHILQFAGFSASSTLQPGYLVTTGTAGLTSNALAAGTASWAVSYNGAAGFRLFISDSVVLNGQDGVYMLSTLTPSNGQAVTFALNLQIIA